LEAANTSTFGILPPSLLMPIWFFNSQDGKGTHMLFDLPHMDVDIDSHNFGPQLVKKVRIPLVIPFIMDFEQLPIRELMDHCLRTEDQAAWSEFFKRITPTISGVVYNRIARCGRPDRGLAQDLVHDTLLKLLDKNKDALRRLEWRHEDAIYGYVKVIASRVVADHFRKRKIVEETLEENLQAAEDSRFSQERLLNNQQCAKVEQVLEKLDVISMEKDIFRFYFQSGFTAKEIGAMADVNLSVKRVETILSRLVRRVRAEIERGNPGAASSA
jgi:RNA polymerase sigma-70 factor (ECF subfamily)